MLPSTNIQSIIGATLYGADNDKIGRISQVLVDAHDGHPTWAQIHIGPLGRHTTYVPLHDATWEHDDVSVPYDKDLVKNAPRPDGDDGLDPTQEQELTHHYTTPTPDLGSEPESVSEPAADEVTPDGPPVQHLDDDGVLWEERVVVSKEKVPVAKVHLETTTVTEEHQITADVQKEHIAIDEHKTPPPPPT